MMNRRTVLIGTAVFAIIVLLAGGAYTAVRLLGSGADGEETAAAASGGGKVVQSISSQDGGPSVAVQTTILPAPELPNEPAAAFGILQSREDNTLLVGTGTIGLEVDIEVNPDTGQESTSLIPTTDGPVLEIVLTPDTILYRDVTDLSLQPGQESGEREVVQQVRQVDSPDDITGNVELEVWGERRGDRIVATVLVYGPLGGGAFE
ncbi:hypothetical protein [Candidatus Leptofilum sp.]|uniref:hypothetical protein n=1 Tax=Candidatus Leptofilum sp. TaxID=3241576 RepID=UPI003B59E93B